VSTTSWTGPSFTFFGGTCVIPASLPNASRIPDEAVRQLGLEQPGDLVAESE